MDEFETRPITISGRHETTVRGAQRLRAEMVRRALESKVKSDSHNVVLSIDAKLLEIEKIRPRAARVAELHYFGEWSNRAIAAELEIAMTDVERDLKFVRALLNASVRL